MDTTVMTAIISGTAIVVVAMIKFVPSRQSEKDEDGKSVMILVLEEIKGMRSELKTFNDQNIHYVETIRSTEKISSELLDLNKGMKKDQQYRSDQCRDEHGRILKHLEAD